MEETTETPTDIHCITVDLMEREILPWLSYKHLAKVARVSKSFGDIVRRIGPFTINTVREGWLDLARIQQIVGRCRSLTLNHEGLPILEHLSQVKQRLEFLDVQRLTLKDDSFEELIISIIKNNTLDSLKELRVPLINFKKLVAQNVICTSVRCLHICMSGYSNDPGNRLQTADVLAVFPSLQRIDLLHCTNNDLYKYLTEHTETPLEFIHMNYGDIEGFEGNIVADIKGLHISHDIPLNKPDALTNLKHLKHLNIRLGRAEVELNLPKFQNLERLEINDYSVVCKGIENASKNLTHLTANYEVLKKIKLPASLKAIETRITGEFDAERLINLPNLESVTLTHDASSFWNVKKCGLERTLKRIHLEGYMIQKWGHRMTIFGNLTHFRLSEAQVEKVPKEFFQNCPKLTHFTISKCRNLTSISRKLRLLDSLEVFAVKSCGLKSIPIGLKRLKNLQEIDLRNNPFDKDCVIPLTLPVRTVSFKDREWIRVLQAYLGNPNKVPTVKKMLKLPYLQTRTQIESGVLSRACLHGLNVRGVEPYDNSDGLAGAIMRKDYSRRYEDSDDDGDESYRARDSSSTYHPKDVTVGIILFTEFNTRNDLRLRLARVVMKGSMIKTYSLEVRSEDRGNGGWYSRSVWKLEGLIHEFKDWSVTEKTKKYIRSVVEPR